MFVIKRLFLFLLLTGLYACGGGSSTDTKTTPTDTPQTQPEPEPNPEQEQEQEQEPEQEPEAEPLVVEGNETFSILLDSDAIKIYEIGNCGDTPGSNTSHRVYIDNSNTINGDIWNWVDNAAAAWDGISKANTAYAISRTSNANDANCSNVATYNHILVKKLGDWTNQHANGFWVTSKSDETIGQLGTVIFDMYYDSANTILPSAAAIEAAYGAGMTGEQLAAWEDSLFRLDIRVDGVEETSDNGSIYKAAYNLALTPEYADKWLRIEIPLTSFEFIRSVGYDNFTSDQATVGTKSLRAIGFVAETKNRLVYRNYDQQGFSEETTAKLFKEIGLRIKRFEITPAE
ncbi:hypothetical protein QFX18_00735 [Saccharophagus degradans]|uniref:hypothetical protein n=1 Tax=Saccharophagus degradans TaxID=86304 RepID=UPI002477F00C|nr:hypothetical protein [Saccharophagus degradans]WGO98586.1 hypothetical protein QFX18_00735 [Saccharophagus degradans]